MSLKQSQFDALVRATSADLFPVRVLVVQEPRAPRRTSRRRPTSARGARSTTCATSPPRKAWLITILRREHARLYERKQVEMREPR
jgi:RNA polymerase sigma-70 factor (ECF subfamily)